MDCQWQNSNKISERILVKGNLVLETPARFGNGDSDGLIDMPLLLDSLERRGLLTGASLAGALRSYLRERELGYEEKDNPDALYALLFGGLQQQNEGAQSPLIVYDALSTQPATTELRDGVAIDPKTRTAEDKKKFDLELLEAGTVFPLRLELLVTEDNRDRLLQGLAIALQGLEKGEIAMGARKRRGFGQCKVKDWTIYRYDLRQPAGLVAWLNGDTSGKWQCQNFGLPAEQLELDERYVFELDATFALDGSLLIRSGIGQANEPDTVHLRSKRGDKLSPILSGTSLAGVLRGRALRIVNTLKGKSDGGWEWVENIFGIRARGNTDKRDLKASRLIVHETEIVNPLDLVQSRIKIDRFTGGVYPGALFNEQPVFGNLNQDTLVKVKLELRQPTPAKIGLLLLLLKDLWTGDLPLGGESSVGRGRLRGIQATLKLADQTWELEQVDERIEVRTGDKHTLESYVANFASEVKA